MLRTLLLLLLLLLAAWPWPSLALQNLESNVEIARPALSSPGDRVEVSCRVDSDTEISGQVCRFESQNYSGNQSLVVDLSALTVSYSGTPGVNLAGYSTQPSDEHDCSLVIRSADETHLDEEWSCHLNEDLPSVPFRRGTFQLLTDGYLTEGIRLPRHMMPQRYEVQLVPVLEEGNFITHGEVSIELAFDASGMGGVEDAERVVLHSRYTHIDEDSVVLTDSAGEERVIVGHEYDLEREFYVIHLDRRLNSAGSDNFALSMTFQSELLDDLEGLYYSTYVDENDGMTKYLAVTQFEAIDARRAFPCLDEPDMKATFAMRLGRTEDMIAASNMPVADSYAMGLEMPGYVVDVFEETPRMSTYLVVVLIADFQTTEANTTSFLQTPFTIWHQPGFAGQADLAAEVGPFLLSEYERYFQVAFPLPKMDMGAVPDFDAGAMENWGLVLYRETLLLFDPEESSMDDYESVVTVIAHELAHMWFGDLVTMEWWDDLWLNEGFATYVEYLGTDFYDPSLEANDRAILYNIQDVFEEDALETAPALSQEILNPEYEGSAGGMEYTKGCSLIRMMAAFLTEEVFNDGLFLYLETHKYDNADRYDLWAALNTTGHNSGVLDNSLDVADIMEFWTDRPGYPVVTVSYSLGTRVTLEQTRFFLNPEAEDSLNTTWHVPITIYYPGVLLALQPDLGNSTKWLTTESDSFEILSTPYVINYREDGYYRVNYQEENWLALQELLLTDPESIDRLNRAQIYDDSFNLARADRLSYLIPLGISKAVALETDYIPLFSALKGLHYLDGMIRQDKQAYPALKSYVTNLLKDLYSDLGFDIQLDDTYPTIQKKNLLIEWLCLYGYEDCVTTAVEKFSEWMTTSDPDEENPIGVDQRETIYEVAIREGGEEEFNFLLERLPNVKTAGEGLYIITGLGKTEDIGLLKVLLDMTITEGSLIRKQDARMAYRSIGESTVGRSVQFAWLVNNYDAIYEYFGPDLFASTVAELLDGFAATAHLPTDISELQAFLENHESEVPVSTLEEAVEEARANEKWVERNFVDVVTWLAENAEDIPDQLEEEGVGSLELNLEITRPSAVSAGDSVDMSCTLEESSEIIGQVCRFEMEELGSTHLGLELLVDLATGEVLANGADDSNFVALDTDSRNNVCGVTVVSAAEEHLGEWKCFINEGLSNIPSITGIFQLLPAVEDSYLKEGIRLPRHLIPDHYDITLIALMEEEPYLAEGDVAIDLTYDPTADDANNYKQAVVLHMKNIHIDLDSVALENLAGTVAITGYEFDYEREFVKILLDSELSDVVSERSYTLSMSFTSNLNIGDLRGFYTSTYHDVASDAEETLAVTQFEAVDARRAFPCLDEPDMKATFKVRLGRTEAMMAASNMPVEQTVPLPGRDGYALDIFQQSEPMSTYLVAFFVGDYNMTTSESTTILSNWTVSVLHQPSQLDQIGLALESAAIMLAGYEDYFEIPYPLPKLDMVAIPDFYYGGMENWGLITYAEIYLSLVEGDSSTFDEKSVLEVVAHEVAHQWFGDLVTMEWWEDLWLNEGFAEYAQHIGVDIFDPTYESYDTMVVTDVQSIMGYDSWDSTTSLSHTVDNPEYEWQPSGIEYSKGASLIRMMNGFLGEDVFKEGLNDYLSEFSYGNADREDLWDALGEAGHSAGSLPVTVNLTSVMDGWTEQPGFPVVNVSGRVGDFVTLEQSRFYLNASQPPGGEVWDIPVSSSTVDGSSLATNWFDRSDRQMTLAVPGSPYLLNYNVMGYYRVNYDRENWDSLTDVLLTDLEQINRLNRAQLLDDGFNLARADLLSYEVPLRMTPALRQETEYIPLYSAMAGFGYLDIIFRNEIYGYPFLKVYIKSLLLVQYQELGFIDTSDGETYPTVSKRDLVVRWMCAYNHQDCLSKAELEFAAWVSEADPDATNPIHPDLRKNVYATAVRLGGETAFDFLLARLPSAKSEGEIRSIIHGLGHASEQGLITRLLDLTITDEEESPIRREDRSRVYSTVGSTAVGRKVQFGWLHSNYDDIKEFYGSSGFPGAAYQLLQGFFDGCYVPSEISELEAFLGEHEDDLFSVSVEMAEGVEVARTNERWAEDNYAHVLGFLQDAASGTVDTTTGADVETSLGTTGGDGSGSDDGATGIAAGMLSMLSAATIIMLI